MTSPAAMKASAPDFDPGPLTWLRPEIDEALSRGCESLAAFCKREKGVAALHEARAQVHQVAGAIRMLGLDAVAEFVDEIERNLVHIEGLNEAELATASAVIERSRRKLSLLLREIASGAPPVGLRLYPEYRAMHRLRGVEAVTPSDLFYPDLGVPAPKAALREAIGADKLASYLAKKRRLYQSGLLNWLRGDQAGANAMRDAVAGIECVTTKDNLRAFWWTVRALLEAVIAGGIENGPDVKQLAGRIDLQIRRFVEGGGDAAERLRREVLYYVALSAPVGPTVRGVQRAFGLSRLIPPPDAIETDLIGIEPLAREARERLIGVKQTWLSFASGRLDHLAKLKQALALVQTRAGEIRHPALVKLTAALVERLDRMPSGAIPDTLAMEFTTALLLAEDAFDHIASLPLEFAQQVDAVLERIDDAAAGRPVRGDAKKLVELGERARERMLLAQLGHEIQANLRSMEEVLDGFFRDGAKRSELTSLARDLSQIHGALRILGLDNADRLLGLCSERIQTYACSETQVAEGELELLAESLCGLGFYFEQVEQQRPGSERVLAPLLTRWLGEPIRPPAEGSESVEAAVSALRAELPRLVEAAHRNDANARGELAGALARLREDAELIGDQALAAQAETAIGELEQNADRFAGAIGAIVAPPAPAPAVSEPAQPLHDGRVAADSTTPHTTHQTSAVELSSRPGADAVAQSTSPRRPVGEPPAATPTREASGGNAGTRAATRDAQRATLVHSASIETVEAVKDEIDADLLVGFLADADALYPVAAEKLRAWRSAPHDEATADELCRTLHAFKGGARMAGAMRLGQLAQLMESQVLASKHRATPELCDHLNADLSLVAYMLDKLRAGEANVALPRLGSKPSSEPETAVIAAVDAGTDDRLRALKATLVEVAHSMTRLRSELRDIEIQTDVQIRSLMTELNGGRGEAAELDGFRRIRGLTQSLGEAFAGLAAVQKSLLRSVDEANAGLHAQPRAVNAN